LLEEFISSKLECSLEEVTSESWANASPDSTETFLSNDFSESTYETTVVLDRVELYSGLDTIYMPLAGNAICNV
jgi:hypothetical protein